MAFAEDLAPFFSDSDFAVQAVVDGVTLRGIFDNAYARGDIGALGMATTQPALRLPTAQVPASPRGKPVVVGAQNFKIVDHEPDGTGVSVLFLEKAS